MYTTGNKQAVTATLTYKDWHKQTDTRTQEHMRSHTLKNDNNRVNMIEADQNNNNKIKIRRRTLIHK